MKRQDAIEAIINYFNENENEFNETIEDLDSYNGFLGDDRYYDMEMLNEFYSNTDPIDILYRAFYGYDEEVYTTDEHGEKHYADFNPNREFFRYNGYGNLVSADYVDYSDQLDNWFAESLIDNVQSLYNIPEEIENIINSIEEV